MIRDTALEAVFQPVRPPTAFGFAAVALRIFRVSGTTLFVGPWMRRE